METESRELEIQEPTGEIIRARELNDGSVAEARRRTEIIEKLKAVAIGHTREKNWTDFKGVPYLDEKGCMTFAQDFGVSFTEPKVEQIAYEDERGKRIDFVATVKAHWLGRTIECDGGRSTADKFWNGTEDDGTVKRLPLSEIRIIDVRKAAVTNAKARATKAILALSFTKEEVEAALRAGGRDPGKMGGVQFRDGKRGGKQGASSANPKRAEVEAKIRKAIMTYCNGDGKAGLQVLWNLTKFKGDDGEEKGATDLRKMSDKWIFKLYATMKEDTELAPLLEEGESPPPQKEEAPAAEQPAPADDGGF